MTIDKQQVLNAVLEKKNERAVTKATLEAMYPDQDWEDKIPPADSDQIMLAKIFCEEFLRFVASGKESWYSEKAPAEYLKNVTDNMELWLNHFGFNEAMSIANEKIKEKENESNGSDEDAGFAGDDGRTGDESSDHIG